MILFKFHDSDSESEHCGSPAGWPGGSESESLGGVSAASESFWTSSSKVRLGVGPTSTSSMVVELELGLTALPGPLAPPTCY